MSTVLEGDVGTPDEWADGGTASAGALRRAIAAFTRVARAAERHTDLDDLLRVVARQIGDLVDVERCSIHLRDDTAGVFRGCVGHAGEELLGPDIKRSLAGVPADGLTAEVVATRRPVVVPNAADDPRIVKSTVRYWKIRAMMAVPFLLEDDVIAVAFLDDVDRRHRFTAADAEVAQAFARLAAVTIQDERARAGLRAELAAAQRQNRALRRASAVEERLTDLVLEGRPLQELLDTLAELLGKPCAVTGPDGRRLATATPPGTADGIAPRLLEAPYADRPEVREALAAHAGSRAFVVGPLPAAGVLHRYCVAPVLVAGATWGNLLVMEHKRRFSGGDMLTLRRAARLIALQVSTEQRATEADWNADASLAAELLAGCGDTDVVARRAARLGVRLDVPRLVALLGGRGTLLTPGSTMPDFRAVDAAFAAVAPGLAVRATAVGDGVAALVDVPDGRDEAEVVAEVKDVLRALLEETCGGERIVAGVSAVHGDPAGYRAAFTEAQQVVACVRRFAPAGAPRVFAAGDLGAGRLFLATSDPELVTGFAEATFGELVDDPTKADLLTTLSAFFDNMASIRRCAERFGVHENTVRYRLSRVEELTGLAITHDPDAQLRARLSLLVLLLQDRLPASAPADASRRSLSVVR